MALFLRDLNHSWIEKALSAIVFKVLFDRLLPDCIQGVGEARVEGGLECLRMETDTSFLINGSMLLEDLIASSNGKCNPIRNFTADELIRATNNWDPRHVVQKCPLLPTWRPIFDELEFFHVDRVSVSVSCDIYWGCLDDRRVLVKKFTGVSSKDEVRSLVIRDIIIATQMSNHKNVLKLIGCCVQFPVPVLVHEYASNGPLNDQGGFGADEYLPWKTRLRIAKELANALTYLHSALRRPVVHRDVRPSCILLDHNLVPKLCNFALSITIPPNQSHASDDVKQTFGYTCLEDLVSGFVTEKSDVYSFGVLLLVFLTDVRYHVRSGAQSRIMDPKIVSEEGGEGQARQLKDFLALASACVQEKSEARPDMIDVANELMRIQKTI
ncbi:Wall-associated receptor kinase-like 1 [Morella rubra]|uniref:Wall-associated receptor kinase-like 1 n=1 Tax=Morella rubra TaxID=262757 RepID=A0A6A1V406_9ROSI|nr:Wall-associated receptor kinase-like 1 [Morella rubra]